MATASSYNQGTMKWLVRAAVLVGLVLCALSFATLGAKKRGPGDVLWQESMSACVRLGVREKYGMLKGYTATFVVTTPMGREYIAEREADDDEFISVYFPDDFHIREDPGIGPWTTKGLYTWQCIVGSSVVISGRFEYLDEIEEHVRVLR